MSQYYFTAAKLLTATTLGIAVFSAPLSLLAAVSQQPLSLTEGVAPNLLVTLDDSGSMAWAYAPDGIATSTNLGRRAWRSNSFNSMYYDPATNYRVPKQVRMVDGEVIVTDYPTPTFTNAPQNGYSTSSTKVDLSKYFRAQGSGTNFISTCGTGIFPAGVCSNGYAPAHYFQYTISASCPEKNPSNSNDCYTYTDVDASQQTNFAIWYSFYRTRNLATRSAANLAFYSLPNNVRLTWGALNTCYIGTGSTTGNCSNNTIKAFSDQHRVNFFNWLGALPQSGGTPLHNALKRAGGFLQNNTKAYRDDDGSEYACRASYHILMTDGMWNGRPSGSTNHDGSLDYPYKDDQANTLADWAYHYWATDLRSGLANKVPPYLPEGADSKDPRYDPADWQHMVNFTVGLGLTNSLQLSSAPTWGGSTFANHDELMNMATNGKRWPWVGDDDPDNVYDLWHAAINSRGEFFSADSPDSLVAAFATILSRIGDRTSSAASPAINSGMQDDGTGGLVSYAYQTSYSSNESWAGDIKGYLKAKTYNTVTGLFDVTTTEKWSAREKLASLGTNRNIMIAAPTGGTLGDTDGLTEFSWSHAGDAGTPGTLAYYLRQDPDDGDTLETDSANAQLRLDFLRGDRSLEDTLFRKRYTVLGDMIASKPVTVRGARYLTSYAERLHPGGDYSDFVEAKRERAPRVYVGANDGMLHGFDATTGQETFAFVPTAVFPKLHELTGKSYQGAHHQFYVDGSPVVADVFLDGEWRTVLVGSLRAGGKGLFALDVTDPDSIKLLWEFHDSAIPDTNDVRLGYSFPQPTVARLHNGKWAVVTGNGYESDNKDNGKAALLIIDMATGELTKSLEVTGTNGVANGLSTPKLADFNADGVADFAYAGDLQGNLWRFNLTPEDMEAPYTRQDNETTAAESGFKVSYSNKPLFNAISESNTRQPITAAPSIIRHPTLHGYLIVFGTGKFFEEGDKDGSSVKQSIYGIWDTDTLDPDGALQPASLARNDLQAQTMNAVLEAEVTGREARLLSQNAVKWAIPPTPTNPQWTDNDGHKYGWYFDLQLSSEMVIENMVTLGRTLFFQTLVPNADPCASGVETWTYAINPQNGGRTLHHAFVDHRSANNPDTVISAVRQDGEGGLTLGQNPDSKYQLCTGLECKQVYPDPSSLGRQSWRPIVE
ncbi:PilC/PilY family type IV pilus protein [Stutzerimonas stutzeri]|uniref:pilus assembly protein n=1 Tax=Stutzerimonas sp. S1 TaxID=3030652 RepID=UPI0022256555|nr:PilC/PilY family type IV pilus protein [Stutzerimonas sp. S1]MCW3147089.1 PilC/PilY family type IV pilus protein [Stutzerimonas sp. S1]